MDKAHIEIRATSKDEHGNTTVRIIEAESIVGVYTPYRDEFANQVYSIIAGEFNQEKVIPYIACLDSLKNQLRVSVAAAESAGKAVDDLSSMTDRVFDALKPYFESVLDKLKLPNNGKGYDDGSNR